MLYEQGLDILRKLTPEIVTGVTAIAVMLMGVNHRAAVRSSAAGVAVIGLLLALLAAVYAAAGQTANPDVYASVVSTPLAASAKIITLLVGVLILLVAWNIGTLAERTDLLTMVLFSIGGVLLVASAGDLIVLVLALEMVSMPTYVLVAIGRGKIQAQEAGVKYFFLGALATAMTVYGMSFLYGATSESRLAGLAARFVPAMGDSPSGLLSIGLVLTVIGVSFKIAAAPLHFYAPDVYEGAATPVTGLLGFLPKMAGFVALVKVLSTAGWIGGRDLPGDYSLLLGVLAAVTMTVGNVTALAQRNVKRILAYSSIAHSGYMLLGLAVGPAVLDSLGSPVHRDGIVAMLFYIGIYGITNLGAFAALAVLRVRDDTAEDIDDLAGLARRRPWVAFALAVCILSLIGIPPLAGFWAKAYLFVAVWSVSAPWSTWLVIIAVVNAAIGAGYYLRILLAMYIREPIWEPRLDPAPMPRLGLALCAIFVILVGLLPGRMLALATPATADFRGSGGEPVIRADAPPARPSEDPMRLTANSATLVRHP